MKKFLAVLLIFFAISGISSANDKIDLMVQPFVSIEKASGSIIRSWKIDGKNWCYVLTAEHVLKNVKFLDNICGDFYDFDSCGNIVSTKQYSGRVEIKNRKMDYAIISFKTPKRYPTVEPATKYFDKLSLFDKVYVVGRPNFQDMWVTEGIISSLNVAVAGRLGHSGQIYYGASGGPLFNKNYQQIAVNVTFSSDGQSRPVPYIAFSVPLDKIYQDLGPEKTEQYFGIKSLKREEVYVAD